MTGITCSKHVTCSNWGFGLQPQELGEHLLVATAGNTAATFPATGRWLRASLSRKLLLATGTTLLCASLVFLVLFLGMYRSQLQRERSLASDAISRLLQSSLENAMLKRDLAGLRDIVTKLGEQQGILRVMIVNPQGEVRFASRPELLGRLLQPAPAANRTSTQFIVDGQGREVLRSVTPVHNRPPCRTCHGSMASNPVNGILYVDHDADEIRTQARSTALLLIGSGTAVTAFALLGAWWLTKRYVLQPVEHLAGVSRRLARGDLDARARIAGADELAQLGQTFNEMARDLQRRLQEIRDKEAFLQALVDAVPDGIRVIDERYRVVLTNAAYREQLGLAQDTDCAGTCYASSHGRNEPCPPTWVACPVHELREHAVPVKTMHHHVHADGHHFPVEVFAANLDFAHVDGSRALIVESIRDIDKAMEFSHEQHLAEMGRLAAGVAHELNNPLTSIRLAVQATLRAILESGETLNADEIRDYLVLVNKEIDQCLQVSGRLLKLAQVPGRHPHLVAVAPAVHDTWALLAPEAAARGIQMSEDFADEDMRVLATDGEVRMVVLNLMQNAFHAMPEGGSLRVRGWRTGARVVLVFDDTGVGIAPRNRPHIFEPFFSDRADGVKGTGLGLSICLAIMKRHDGSIQVDDDSAPGSRFRISFPDPDAGQ